MCYKKKSEKMGASCRAHLQCQGELVYLMFNVWINHYPDTTLLSSQTQHLSHKEAENININEVAMNYKEKGDCKRLLLINSEIFQKKIWIIRRLPNIPSLHFHSWIWIQNFLKFRCKITCCIVYMNIVLFWKSYLKIC